jgi:cell division protein FtsI (penicillin-binding protein 3)
MMDDDNRNPQQPYEPIRWKAGLLVLFFAAAFLMIVGRLFWVQVVQGSHYREIARKQYESRVELRAERGRMVDRNGRDVATMMRTTSFAADPTMVRNADLLADLLASADGKDKQWYLDRIRKEDGRFTWLARGVNTVLFPALSSLRDPGVIRVEEPKRHFVYGPVAAQMIGTTDVDNKGLSGLELYYDDVLRGTAGFVVMQRDGRGRLRPSINPERKAPQHGAALQLTIDIELQRVVEQELERGVRDAGAAGGTVIALEPSTGDVLAMASYPSFDPTRLDRASNDAIRIHGITDQYEPGSTMKAITAAALLEERRLAPADQVDGKNGQTTIFGHVVRDDHPMGLGTFSQAMEQSSNVVFATAAQTLNDRVFYKYVRDFGFGIPSGIDLPGEVRGRLKRPHEFDVTTKTFMSYGYEVSATALQIVNAYATIANRGVMMQPRVVRSVLESDGTTRRTIEPQRVRRVVSEPTAQALTTMLEGVVRRGTGSAAAIDGVRIAGKTGTAQQLEEGTYSRKAYTASFVGFYPANAPRVAMIVMLDRPTSSIYGGTTAAPIFKRIVQKTITMLSIDETTRQRVAASAEADSVVVPDVRGLMPGAADTVLKRLGLSSVADTSMGPVIRQYPPPGSRVERKSRIVLSVQRLRGRHTERPDVTGFPLRRAVTTLHAAGFSVRVRGSGTVERLVWDADTCTLFAR